MLQVGNGVHDVRVVRALALEQRRNVHEHPLGLGVEIADVNRPAVLVEARGPGDVQRRLVRRGTGGRDEIGTVLAGLVERGRRHHGALARLP